MESGPTVASYIGYGIVCLFLLAVTIGVLRSAMFFSSLIVLPFVRNKDALEPALELARSSDDAHTSRSDSEITR